MKNRNELINACERGNLPLIQKLLKEDCCFVNEILDTTEELTLLMIASQKGVTRVVKFLLSIPDINVNVLGKSNRTALHFASLGHTDCLSLLLTHPQVDVNKQDRNGWTPLHAAVENGHRKCVALLLRQPTLAVNDQDHEGDSALHIAAIYGKRECISLLHDHPQIEMNLQDKLREYGNTALSAAALSGHLDCVSLLIGYPEVQRSVRNMDGKTAAEICCDYYFEDDKEVVKSALFDLLNK